MKRLLDGRKTVCEISLANVDLADNLQIDVKQRRFDGTAAHAVREQLLPLKILDTKLESCQEDIDGPCLLAITTTDSNEVVEVVAKTRTPQLGVADARKCRSPLNHRHPTPV